MAATAITAPKSGGQLVVAGKHLSIETVIVDDRDALARLGAWMAGAEGMLGFDNVGVRLRAAVCCHRAGKRS
jgi:hypothetical protein